MNYYIFYCAKESSFYYLNGTHYVGVWAGTYLDALERCKSCINDNLIYVEKRPKNVQIGYLY